MSIKKISISKSEYRIIHNVDYSNGTETQNIEICFDGGKPCKVFSCFRYCNDRGTETLINDFINRLNNSMEKETKAKKTTIESPRKAELKKQAPFIKQYCIEQAIAFHSGRHVTREELFETAEDIFEWVYGYQMSVIMSAVTSEGNNSKDPEIPL
jgi:hypothetical protein